MAFQSYWYKTNLPQEMVDIIIKDLKDNKAEDLFQESELMDGLIDPQRRKSKNAWINTSHWISGFLWFYIDKINKENFKYDLMGIDNDSIQYTQYEEGEHYTWHTDSSFSQLYTFSSQRNSSVNLMNELSEEYQKDFLRENVEVVRKLSFTLQLSDPDDYEGGEVQMIGDNGGLYTIPKERGTLVAFDSRTMHRVRKVKKGVRRSIVGWCVGPRWK